MKSSNLLERDFMANGFLHSFRNFSFQDSRSVEQKLLLFFISFIIANIYFFKINNRHLIKRGQICSKLTTETPEQRH